MIKRLINWLFPRECDHTFKVEDVVDLNRDPKCELCGKYFSAISGRRAFDYDQKLGKYRLTKIK